MTAFCAESSASSSPARFGTATVFLLFLVGLRLSGRIFAAALGALALAVGNTFWSQAIKQALRRIVSGQHQLDPLSQRRVGAVAIQPAGALGRLDDGIPWAVIFT